MMTNVMYACMYMDQWDISKCDFKWMGIIFSRHWPVYKQIANSWKLHEKIYDLFFYLKSIR